MSEMTATRTALGIIAAGLWLGAAWLLLRTTVPDLALGDVPLGAAPAELERARVYARGARPFVLGALLAPPLAVALFAAVTPGLARRLPGPRVARSLLVLA